MVWYGMVWYGMVWYGMVWHGMVYGMIWYGTATVGGYAQVVSQTSTAYIEPFPIRYYINYDLFIICC
jgi:hypothetical protein